MALSEIDVNLSDTLPQDNVARERSAALSERQGIPPSQVPGLEIISCLGQGAFGSVWLATEINTGKQVAVKFYSHSRGLDWSLLNREVEKLASLYTSREIVGLISVGWNAQPPYYVMEYLEHGSLARRLEQGLLSPAEAIRIVTSLAQALVHAHRHGILHCDVKPANVLLDGADSPRLADFGQSRLSDEQDPALGTLFYMAPEQSDLSAIPNARWDVYALGVLLYEMLTGEVPYKTPENERRIAQAGRLHDRLAEYRKIVLESPRPTLHRQKRGVDSRLAEIVDRCLETDPARRLSTAEQVLQGLRQRAHLRSRRPFILIPALLLLALMPLVYFAMNSAVRTAEENLAARAIESDLVSARILATALQKSLETRKFQLQQIADDAGVRAAVAAGATRPTTSAERESLGKLLAEFRAENYHALERLGMAADDSWFLDDAHGFQRWRDPPSANTLDKDFSHRDYFHGLGEGISPERFPAEIQPITEPHVSRPYRSTTDQTYKVAISVPVWDLSQDRVIGVLARTIPLGKLLVEYQDLIRNDEVQRVISLVEYPSWRLLDHPWMTNENLQSLPDETVNSGFILPKEQHQPLNLLVERLRRGEPPSGAERQLQYHDPVGRVSPEAAAHYGDVWLAAFWPVRDTPWLAIVQERRATAMQPVWEIQEGLVTYALGGLFVCFALVACLWVFEIRQLTAETGGLMRPPALDSQPQPLMPVSSLHRTLLPTVAMTPVTEESPAPSPADGVPKPQHITHP